MTSQAVLHATASSAARTPVRPTGVRVAAAPAQRRTEPTRVLQVSRIPRQLELQFHAR